MRAGEALLCRSRFHSSSMLRPVLPFRSHEHVVQAAPKSLEHTKFCSSGPHAHQNPKKKKRQPGSQHLRDPVKIVASGTETLKKATQHKPASKCTRQNATLGAPESRQREKVHHIPAGFQLVKRRHLTEHNRCRHSTASLGYLVVVPKQQA